MRYANNLIHCLFVIMSFSLLGGCDSDATTGNAAFGPVTIRGKVISDEGPVTSGVVKAVNAQGQTLTSTELKGDPHFRIQIPSDAVYPVILSASFGEDKTLEAAITSSLAIEQDITPYSDLVVKSARALGGVTPENIARAAGGAIGQRGQRIAGFAGETTTHGGTRLKRGSGGDHGH